jgi:vacuolar-type H+-ATPase subunit H
MADSEHKDSKERRAPRRGVLKRGERRPGEESKSGSQRGDESSAKSLLETTSEEVKQLLAAADDAAEKIREAAKTESALSGDGDGNGGKATEAASVVASLNKEVKQVLEAADDAAEKIREEAREEARRMIEDTRRRAESATSEQMNRVTELSEQVLKELGTIDEQTKRLRKAFDQSIRAMSADLGVEDMAVWDTKNGAIEEEQEGELRQRLGRRRKMVPAREPEGISEGARLLALQQLTAGVDPKVIEERLRKEFGVENPKPLLEWMGVEAQDPRKSRKS